MAPYRGALGNAGRAGGAQAGPGGRGQGQAGTGRARGAQAGLGDLPGHCIVSSDPGRGRGFLPGCSGRRGAGKRVLSWSVPLQQLNTGTSSTDLKERWEGEDDHIANP